MLMMLFAYHELTRDGEKKTQKQKHPEKKLHCVCVFFFVQIMNVLLEYKISFH